MDYVLDWRLIHRDESKMDELYCASKFGKSSTRVLFEDEGINLFAECVKDQIVSANDITITRRFAGCGRPSQRPVYRQLPSSFCTAANCGSVPLADPCTAKKVREALIESS
jgi:hypothetical protein